MDRVRFGRALGYGARHAAKAMAKAVDAATAPNPAAPGRPAASRPAAGPAARPGAVGLTAERQASAAKGSPAGARDFGRAAPQSAPGGIAGRMAQAQAGVRQGKAQAGHLRRHIWSPLVKFSSVVWLQVTGTFFTLLAVFLSQGLWKERAAVALPVNSHEAEKLYLHAAAFAIFVYFAVSSFVRAHLRQRR